jgi:hypothetical protein
VFFAIEPVVLKETFSFHAPEVICQEHMKEWVVI